MLGAQAAGVERPPALLASERSTASQRAILRTLVTKNTAAAADQVLKKFKCVRR
jgi:hypothetical protein